MGTQTRTWTDNYDTHKAYFFVQPREEMTWLMLAHLTDGVARFVVYQGNHIQFQFLLLVDGVEGEVGLGQVGRYNRSMNRSDAAQHAAESINQY